MSPPQDESAGERVAVVRPPSAGLEAGERTHVGRRPIDPELALRQHASYVEALTELGYRVHALEPAPDLADATFVEDPAIVLEEALVLGRPGVPSRRPEVERLDSELHACFEAWRIEREALHIQAPATLEGGDVLRIDDVLYVGQSTRTDHAGLKQLAHLVLPHGLRVKAASVAGALHLKTACTYLGRDTLLANERWVDLHRLPRMEVLAVDPAEPFAANALAHEGRVVLPASCPRTAERVTRHGFEVLAIDVSEFEKAEAGLTCLSLRFAR